MEKREFSLSIFKSILIALVNGLAIPLVLTIPVLILSLFINIDVYHPMIQSLISITSAVCLVYYFNRRNKLGILNSFKSFSKMYGVILSLIPFMVGFSILISEFTNWFGTILPINSYFEQIFSEIFSTQYGLVYAILSVAIIAPFVEEIIFRGIIFKGLKNRYSPVVSIIVSAFIFAFAHFNPWQFSVAFLWGLVSAWLYYNTNSLIPCIVGHMVNNSLSYIFIYALHIDIPGYTTFNESTIYQPLWFDMLGIALLMLGGVMILYFIMTKNYKEQIKEIQEVSNKEVTLKEKKNIKDLLGKEIFILDGSLGTFISQKTPDIKFPDELNIVNPQLMQEIHKMYVDSGSNIITTNTFGANDYKLQYSSYSMEEIITAAVDNAKKASQGQFIALDVGPLGQLMEPLGDINFYEAYEQFKKQVVLGEKLGCDLILIETMSDIMEAKIAVLAAKENTELPVVCTMTFNEKGRTINGTNALTMVSVLEGLGVDAVGVNCSYGPDKLIPVVKEVLKWSSVPVIVQPNAGLPIVTGSGTVYDITKNEFASYIKEMVDMGVSIVGGCCGTTPDYIKECVDILKNTTIKEIEPKSFTMASSARNTLIFDDLTVIGEALVPTGRKKYIEALESGDETYYYFKAKEQKELGAQVINVNVSTPGIDEKQAMIAAVEEISYSVDCPLQIDSINPDIIETALRIYPGKGIINSVNGKRESMEKLFPVAKKYGSLIIGMTFDEKGIPSGSEERFNIAEKIVKCALEYGITKKNIIIDCLSLTAQVYQNSLMDSLQVVRRVKNELGVKTMLGVANVSYGLPNRSLLDRTYFAMALSQGLDVVMMSVYDEEMMDTIKAYKVLANIDLRAKEYINLYQKKADNDTKNMQIKNYNDSIKIIIASVKGDTINPGLPVLDKALKELGCTVNNLGTDVGKEEVLDKARETQVKYIGLSAFSPYSLISLKETVAYIRENLPYVKIFVGGASVKENLMGEIGADYYASNAEQLMELIKKLQEN